VNIVTSYVNPDIDGVAGMLAVAELRRRAGENYRPVVFGSLDAETEVVLRHVGLAFPTGVGDVNSIESAVVIDCHSPLQLASEVSPESVVEVIDHHVDQADEVYPNILRYRNELVGAACTLVLEDWIAGSARPPDQYSTLLAAGIFSNTQGMTGPSVTDRDRRAYSVCTQGRGLPDSLVAEMARARASDIGSPLAAVFRDVKAFAVGERIVRLSQIEAPGSAFLIAKPEWANALKQFQTRFADDETAVSVVDTASETTDVFTDSPLLQVVWARLGEARRGSEWVLHIPRIALRKTDLVPLLDELETSRQTQGS